MKQLNLLYLFFQNFVSLIFSKEFQFQRSFVFNWIIQLNTKDTLEELIDVQLDYPIKHQSWERLISLCKLERDQSLPSKADAGNSPASACRSRVWKNKSLRETCKEVLRLEEHLTWDLQRQENDITTFLWCHFLSLQVSREGVNFPAKIFNLCHLSKQMA